MKTFRIIALLIVLPFSAGLLAQTTWNMGLKAGLSLSGQSVIFRLTDEDYQIETGNIAGPTGSLFVEYTRDKRWGIQLDAAYIPKGSSTHTESITVHHLEGNRITENTGEQTISRHNYLSLAPQFRYRILKSGFTPYVMAGARVDFLLAYNTDSSYPLDDQNKVIPGLNLGAGLEAYSGSLGLFLEVLFQGDIIPVTGTEPMLINNHTGLFTIGLRYSL